MDYQAAHESIVGQLADFARNAHFSECVIGLSGGLDSTVVAVLCAEAFGSSSVHGVLMPGPYSSDASSEDALEVARNLEIPTTTISITGAYDAFARALAPTMGEDFAGVASENTQARCRMVVLMALSNAYGWMLVNTGNRSEAYMGYSTLYGDTAGAFAPLGSMFKTDVFAFARYLNERYVAQGKIAPIPQRVIDKPPSAELAPDQTDEEGLGIGYAELDRILAGHFDAGLGADVLASQSMSAAQVDDVLSRARKYAYKRTMLPPAAVLP
ncbi:MAG: NAD(+) synthase [Eggerthellaceae bacterium]|nr:NAD(+) synthase [Eggerthellaceae bacterium]